MSQEKDDALKSIFKGASIVFVGIIISKIFGLLFRVLVGRHLGPSEYGVITLMMAVFSVATTFGHLGIHNGVQRYISFYRGEEEHEKVIGTIRTGYIMIFMSSLIAGIILFVLSPVISIEILNERKLIWPLRMISVILPLWGVARISISTTNALEKMQYKVYISQIWTNVTEVGLAAILIYLGYSYLGAAFAYAFGFGTSAILGIYYVKKLLPETFARKKAAKYNFDELWSHSWPLLAAGVFGVIIGHIDTFMIQYFKGSESVGLYQAAYPFAALLLIGNKMFSSIFLSRASYLTSKSEKDLSKTFKVVVKWISIITVPIFLLLLAYPRSVLILFGAEYYQVENVLRILLIGFFLNTIIGPANRVYQAIDRTKVITLLSIILATANFALNLILIPIYSITGAAIASAASFGLIFVVKILYLYRFTGTLPFRKSILKVMASGIIAISIIYLTTRLFFSNTPEWFLAPALIMYAVLYPSCVLLSGTIESEDLEIVYAIDEKIPFNVKPLINIIERFSEAQ